VESIEMYEIIAKMGPDTLRREEAMVNTKYKTVEKKVKPAAGPLPADNEQKRKEVSGDPTLRKAVDIGHTFTDDTHGKLRIGGGGFLLPWIPGDVDAAWESLCVYIKGDRLRQPKDRRADGDLYD
jgi:hypothetical protein